MNATDDVTGEQTLYNAVVSSLAEIKSIFGYLDVEAHPDKTVAGVKKLNATTGLFTQLDTIYAAISSDTRFAQFDLYLPNAPVNSKRLKETWQYYIDKSPSGGTVLNVMEQPSELTTKCSGLLTGVWKNVPLSEHIETINNELKSLKEYIQEINKYESTDQAATYKTALFELEKIRGYYNAKTTKHNKTISGLTNLLSGYPTLSGLNLSTKTSGDDFDFKNTVLNPGNVSGLFTTFVDSLTKLTDTAIPGSQNLNPVPSTITISGSNDTPSGCEYYLWDIQQAVTTSGYQYDPYISGSTKNFAEILNLNAIGAPSNFILSGEPGPSGTLGSIDKLTNTEQIKYAIVSIDNIFNLWKLAIEDVIRKLSGKRSL